MISTGVESRNRIGKLLNTNKLAKLLEILIVFASALVLIKLFTPLARNSPVVKQAIIWTANILMLFLVWLGIKLRGQKLSDFGLTFGRIRFKESLGVFLRSLLVFVLALVGFVIGSIIMANVTGVPESADTSNYTYLQHNVFLFILTLLGVYIVSSFGEEVIYRAFLINRLTELGLDSKAGKAIAVILSAIIFGLVHYEWGPMGMVQTGFMGVVLGFAYLKLKKKLWVLVLAHAYMDTILMTQMFLGES